MALATLADPAQAQGQWKWRDAQGRVTVSDLPPPREVADKDILQRPAAVARAPAPAVPGVAPAAAGAGVAAPGVAASAPAAARPAPVDKELEARKRAAEAEKAAKAKAEEQRAAAVRAENCKRARQHLGRARGARRRNAGGRIAPRPRDHRVGVSLSGGVAARPSPRSAGGTARFLAGPWAL